MTTMMRTWSPKLVSNQPDPRIPGGLPRGPFHLGMPHLAEAGLSVSWLLSETCHGHRWAIAMRSGHTPSAMRDATGARAYALVVSANIAGRLAAFAEDDVVEFRRVVWPSPETGWRSVTVLISRAGAHAVVELVTAFARKDEPTNAALGRARMPLGMRPMRHAPECRRATLLRAIGRAERMSAKAMGAPPDVSLRVEREAHMNGSGLCSSASLVTAFAAAEPLALPHGWRHVARRRELHFFGNLDAGDHLDIVLRPTICALEGPGESTVESVARRRSDSAVIATCKTRFLAVEQRGPFNRMGSQCPHAGIETDHPGDH